MDCQYTSDLSPLTSELVQFGEERKEFHQLSELFPLMEGEEFDAFVKDIRDNGLRVPIVLYEGQILEGRNRYLACLIAGVECRFETYDGDDPVAYVISMNVKRRHLDESQRAMLASKLANMVVGGANAQICANAISQSDAAKLLSVSRRSVQNAVAVRNSGDVNLIRAVERGKVSVSKAAKKLIFKKGCAEKREKFHKLTKIDPRLHVGDFRKLSHTIPDNSVELVFTDPPWDRDSVPLYGDAAAEAARILKPGGSMITYVGGANVPAVAALMSEHLTYLWLCASLRDGGPLAQNDMLGIQNAFVPMLWFVKGYRGDTSVYVRDVVSGSRQKQFHEWQQSIEDAEHFIQHLTSPNGIVVDFFAGGGTTIAAAIKLKRQWVAFEIDETAIPAITERIAAA